MTLNLSNDGYSVLVVMSVDSFRETSPAPLIDRSLTSIMRSGRTEIPMNEKCLVNIGNVGNTFYKFALPSLDLEAIICMWPKMCLGNELSFAVVPIDFQ